MFEFITKGILKLNSWDMMKLCYQYALKPNHSKIALNKNLLKKHKNNKIKTAAWCSKTENTFPVGI